MLLYIVPQVCTSMWVWSSKRGSWCCYWIII